jgi:hypothetical protein
VEDLTLVIELIDGALTRTSRVAQAAPVDALLDLRLAVSEMIELAELEALL